MTLAWWIDGEHVRALREAAGLSRSELARRAGLLPEWTRRWEHSGPETPIQPRRSYLSAVALTLGVEPEDLVDGDRDAFSRGWGT